MIKKILSKIFAFQKKSKCNILNEPEGNYILITFPKNCKEPYIRLNVTDLSQEECTRYSQALFNLNSGRYHQSFLDLLKEMSHQDVTINKFIQALILHWSYLIKANSDISSAIPESKNLIDNDYDPIISPMEFNKHAK